MVGTDEAESISGPGWNRSLIRGPWIRVSDWTRMRIQRHLLDEKSFPHKESR